MNRKKQKKLNSLNWKQDKKKQSTTDTSNQNESLVKIEFIENLSLFKFKQLINSASSKDVEKGLYSINKMIRDEKERDIDENSDNEDEDMEDIDTDNQQPNFKNKRLSIVFEFLKSSPQLNEIFTIWETCIDKYQVYQNVYSLLLEFTAIIITINDDPSLQHQIKVLADKIISNKSSDLFKIITNYNQDTINLTINCFRLLSAIIPLSLKIAKQLSTNIDFTSNGFQKAMNDLSINGAYLGTRPYVLRFLLSFLKHHNIKLSEFIMENENLLLKYCQKLQMDHHNVVLDLIESLEVNILRVNNISKILKIKFFSTSFLSKIGLIFSKDDIGEDCRQSIYKFLTVLCCSSTHGIISSDPKWTWFRDNDNPSFENKSIVSLITELNPIAYQTHQSLFIKIINACPDLFTSYLKKLGTCEVSLSLNWLNRTTMLIKTLSSPIPKAPTVKITSSKLLESIPSSPLVLINLLIPLQISNLTFFNNTTSNSNSDGSLDNNGNSNQPSQLVTYNQLLVLLLCLKRVNQVLQSLNQFLIDKQNYLVKNNNNNNNNNNKSSSMALSEIEKLEKENEIEKLISFIENLKNGIKERLPQFRWFKEHVGQFKSSSIIYSQYISIIAEYFRYLPITDFISLKMFDYQMLSTSDLFTQKQFISIIGFSKTFHTTNNLFNSTTSSSPTTTESESILTMLLKLNQQSKSPEIKSMYNQLIFKLLSVNNIFSSVDFEIDLWLENINKFETIEFFESTLINALQNKFQYVDLVQNISKQLFGSNLNQLLISPVLVSTIFQLATKSDNCINQFEYISNVLLSISYSKKNSILILSIFNFIIEKQQQQQVSNIKKDNNNLIGVNNYNLPKELEFTINFIYYQSYSKYSNNYKLQSNGINSLKSKLIECKSTNEIQYTISTNFENSILLEISNTTTKDELDKLYSILKVSPIHLILSQLNLLNSIQRVTIFKDNSITSILLMLISNCPTRKLQIIYQTLENLIELKQQQQEGSSSSDTIDYEIDFYFNCLEKLIKIILDSKSMVLVTNIIEKLFSTGSIVGEFLKSFKFSFNISKLILAILTNENGSNCHKIISPFINMVLDKFNDSKTIEKSSCSTDLIISIRVLELILPFLNFNSCIELLSTFKLLSTKQLVSNQIFLQIYFEIINSTIQLYGNGDNTNVLPSYFNLTSSYDYIGGSSKTIGKISFNSNVIDNQEICNTLKSTFIQLIQISNESKQFKLEFIYKTSIDQFILQFLLNDINQIIYPTNLILSIIGSGGDKLSNYLNYCLENYTPTTSTILSIFLLSNNSGCFKLNLELLNFETLFKFDIQVWLSFIYLIVLKNNIQDKKLKAQVFNAISNSNIFNKNENNNNITTETYNIIIKLYQFVSIGQSTNSLLNSKLNYLILFNGGDSNGEQELSTELIKSIIINYCKSLVSTSDNSTLFNLNLCNFNQFIKYSNQFDFEKIIKFVFSNFSESNFKLIESIINSLNSKSTYKYKFYIDLIFREICENNEIIELIKTTCGNLNGVREEDGNEEQLSNNIIRYRILLVLLSIYENDPNLCHSGKNLSSRYFGIYNATTHPIDQVLLKIIIQHDRNNHSILSESNYLWGKHSKESFSINQLLLSNTFFSGNQFENSILNYPFDINSLSNDKKVETVSDSDDSDSDSDSDEEMEIQEESTTTTTTKALPIIDKVNLLKSYNEFSYDPSFLLGLFISLLDSYISEYSLLDNQQEDLRRENTDNLLKTITCFFYNGPFSFTVRSTSSKQLSIRQLAYSILSKNQKLLDIYQKQLNKTVGFDNSINGVDTDSSKPIIGVPGGNNNRNHKKKSNSTESLMFKLISVLKSTIFEKDQYIPSIFTLFYCNSIKIISSKSDINRKSITSFIKGIASFDLTHIPMFSNVLNFSANKTTVIWILELISNSLPDVNTEFLLKKNNSISLLLGLFDSFISTSKIKSSILSILLNLSTSTTGIQLLIKQGILPWLSILISNSSCLKLFWDLIFKLFNNILSNLLLLSTNNGDNNSGTSSSSTSTSNEFYQLLIILNNCFKLFLNINWDIEFKNSIQLLLSSLKSIIQSSSNNQHVGGSMVKVSGLNLVSLIKSYKSIENTNCGNFISSDDEKLKLLESTIWIVSNFKLSNNNETDSFIFNWFWMLLNNGDSQQQTITLIEPILKWIQDSLLCSKKQFLSLLNGGGDEDKEQVGQIRFYNQLFNLVNQIDIKLSTTNDCEGGNIQLLKSKKLICNIMILLTPEKSIMSIISSKYDQHHFYQLLSNIQSPNNQKSDDIILYKQHVANIIEYLKELFFSTK